MTEKFMPNSNLGRGLSSLIPQKVNKIKADTEDAPAVVDITTDTDKDKILKISPEKIKANTMQPRQRFTDINMEELVKSIKTYGIIQPLVVTQKDGDFELIAGERRLRAAKSAGLTKVPVIVREVAEQEKLEMALVENLQREDLNSIDMAMAYRKLIDEFNLNQEEVAKRVGKSRPTITNTLRMLNLPEEIQLALIEGKIRESHAKYIAGLETEEKQMILFRKILHKGLNIDQVGIEARKMGGTKMAKIKINYQDKDKEFSLREFFNTKAEIKRKKKGGQIIIDFYSDEELGEMIDKIK